jgi:ABC-2 type transport system permease protein/lipopolysaccharide transport system permease protein
MLSIVRSEDIRGSAQSLPLPPSRTLAGWRDLVDGAAKSWIWMALAVQDIRLRYRGSMLGPFWLTISTVVMTATMGLIYSILFNLALATYLPFLAIGLVIWQFISAAITEGCETFLRVDSVIQQIPIPFSIHAYRTVCRNLLVLAHSFVIIPVALVLFPQSMGWHVVESILGLALLPLNALWISILLGMVSVRFRDIPPIVASFLQVMFFLTPVLWPIAALGPWKAVLALNPLFAIIDIIRAPLLGATPLPTSWGVVMASTIVGCATGFVLFARLRTRIPYWI